jgi:hypothetical protein
LIQRRIGGLFHFSMSAKKKLGFNGQWVDGTPVGTHVDSDGDEVKIDTAFLEAVVSNFNKTKNLHQPPAVIGHPKTDSPAYAYVAELRVNNGRLERRFSETQPGFEDLVQSGAYRKRSDAFYLDSKVAPGGLVPALRHVGFLGVPPAIKGIADIHFAEGDTVAKTVDVEVDTAINFSEENEMDEKTLDKKIGEGITNWLKRLVGGSGDKPAAQFSEDDQKRLRDEIAETLKAEFSEELKTRDTKIEELTTQISSQAGSSARAQAEKLFAGFVEKGILPPAFKDRATNLFEALAKLPSDKQVSVIEFAEDGVTEKSKKDNTLLVETCELIGAFPPYITFGESYGGLQAAGDAKALLGDTKQIETMRKEFGLKDKKA